MLLEAWNEFFGEPPWRACEGRPMYWRRPGCRSPGRPYHFGAPDVVSAPSVGDAWAARQLACRRRRVRDPLARCRWRP